jgi:hypothetical protein
MSNERIKDFFRNNLGFFAVGFVALSYVATSFITIEESGKSVWQIIADGTVVFILGILINRIFEVQGIVQGDRDPRVRKTSELHGEIVEQISSHMNELDDWCEQKNEEALLRIRRRYLAAHGMRYDQFFDEDGIAKPYPFKSRYVSRRERWHDAWQYRRYRRAVTMKLTRLTASLLISDGGDADDPYYMGRSKVEYEKSTFKGDVITKTATALLFGYYGVSMIQNFSWANLIWMILQVGIFLVMGVVKLQQAQLYVTDEYRARIIKKIDVLEMFANDMNIKIERREEKNVE